ncbi:MAG: hypothetical protein QGH45_05560 [Myxococcota bacterium]|jgi:hypothetical protein|nr:hypothetical protein [Myxococcota bacterium]
MVNLTRLEAIALSTCLVLALAGAALADEPSASSATHDDLGDPICEQDVADLQLWLYSMAAEADRLLSDEPLDAQLQDPVLQPLAAQVAGECSPLGWALTRVGPATGRQKVLLLAEYLPAAIEECDCAVDLAALSYLLWRVSASPRVIKRGEAGLESRFGRLDRTSRDLEQPVDQHIEKGRQNRARWTPR